MSLQFLDRSRVCVILLYDDRSIISISINEIIAEFPLLQFKIQRYIFLMAKIFMTFSRLNLKDICKCIPDGKHNIAPHSSTPKKLLKRFTSHNRSKTCEKCRCSSYIEHRALYNKQQPKKCIVQTRFIFKKIEFLIIRRKGEQIYSIYFLDSQCCDRVLYLVVKMNMLNLWYLNGLNESFAL